MTPVPAGESPAVIASLPEWPWRIVCQVAAEQGTRVWLVGGAVRDAWLGRPFHDWDFAVERGALGLARAVADALGGAYFPLDVEREAGRALLTTGEGVRLELDFVTLRGEGLEGDLLARDFTVNALALDDDKRVVDATGGLADLESGVVRAVSERAFQDDPVRLLRAVRVEAELGFGIEPQTASWLNRDAALLSSVSAERVRDELARMLALPGAAGALQRLDAFGLLARVIPELETLKGVTQSAPHRHDVWRHTLAVVGALEGVIAAATGQEVRPGPLVDAPAEAWGELARAVGQFAGDISAHLAVEVSGGRSRTQLLKLAALLHDVGKPGTRSQDDNPPGGGEGRIHFYNHELVGAQIAGARLEALRYSREEVERARTLVGAHMRPAHLARSGEITRRAVYRYFRATSCGGVDVVLLCLADHLATWGPGLEEGRWARRLEVAEALLGHWFERYEETVAPPRLVTGGELIAKLGLEAGPQVGRLLEAVREAQAAGEVHTREEALALARRMANHA